MKLTTSNGRLRQILPFVLIGIPAIAQGAAPTQPSVPDIVARVTQCRAVKVEMERLACFDQATAALDFAVVHKDIVVMDKEEVRQTKRSLFGFSIPNLSAFGFGDKSEPGRPAEPPVLDTSIRAVRQVAYGKWDMETVEQAVWRNVDLIDSPPAVGEKIHIKQGTLGSFFLRPESGRPVRAQRVR